MGRNEAIVPRLEDLLGSVTVFETGLALEKQYPFILGLVIPGAGFPLFWGKNPFNMDLWGFEEGCKLFAVGEGIGELPQVIHQECFYREKKNDRPMSFVKICYDFRRLVPDF